MSELTPVFTKQELNTVTGTWLSAEQIAVIREKHNNHNRPLNLKKVAKFKKLMLSGLWDWNFLEGNTLVIDHTDAECLSAQHRIEAFHQLHTEGHEGFDKWYVTVNYVDRDFWLANSHEKRSASDVLAMLYTGSISKQFANAISIAKTQLGCLERGFSARRGSTTASKDFIDAHSKRIAECWNALPEQVKINAALAGSLMALYLADKITLDDDIKQCMNPNTRIGSAYVWLTAMKAFGQHGSIKSVSFALATLEHAKRTTLGDDYLAIADEYKPQSSVNGVTPEKYTFADYI